MRRVPSPFRDTCGVREGAGERQLRWKVIGLALVGLAGIVLVGATYLPWVTQQGVTIEESASHPFGGGKALRSYSGWELEQRCGQSDGFGSCSMPVVEGRRPMFTGVWTLILGASFVLVAGAMTVAMIRGWRVAWRCFLGVSWVVAIIATGIAMLIWLIAEDLSSQTFGLRGPGVIPDPVRYGIMLVGLGAATGLVGTGIATFSGRRKAAPASDASSPTAIAALGAD
jgi:hypothetical protein